MGHLHTKTMNRLQAALLEHDFIIQYKKGEIMPADYLSRIPGAKNSEISEVTEVIRALLTFWTFIFTQVFYLGFMIFRILWVRTLSLLPFWFSFSFWLFWSNWSRCWISVRPSYYGLSIGRFGVNCTEPSPQLVFPGHCHFLWADVKNLTLISMSAFSPTPVSSRLFIQVKNWLLLTMTPFITFNGKKWLFKAGIHFFTRAALRMRISALPNSTLSDIICCRIATVVSKN